LYCIEKGFFPFRFLFLKLRKPNGRTLYDFCKITEYIRQDKNILNLLHTKRNPKLNESKKNF